jgi:hypothetical protein
MTKLVTIKAVFKTREEYLAQNPLTVEFLYYDGGALTAKDRAKVEAITKYYLDNELYPVFVLNELAAGPSPLVGEATLNLNQWTTNGLPMFPPKDMQNQSIDAPMFKAKQRQTSLS